MVNRGIRKFGTSTGQLLALREWLLVARFEHAAMESMGPYWESPWDILERHIGLTLVNRDT